MPNRSLEHQEIVRLLANLKEETPEYPAELLEARKYSFLKQVVDLQISSKEGPSAGGKGRPGGSAGSGPALSGGATVLGIPLKTALAIGAAILMLTAGYLFREEIVEFLAENGLVTSEETATPPFASTPDGPAQETPTFESPSSGSIETPSTPGPGNAGPGELPGAGDGPAGTPTPPAQSGPASVFQYLVCVLQNGAESCR